MAALESHKELRSGPDKKEQLPAVHSKIILPKTSRCEYYEGSSELPTKVTSLAKDALAKEVQRKWLPRTIIVFALMWFATIRAAYSLVTIRFSK